MIKMPGSREEYEYWGERAHGHEESYLYIVGPTINQELKSWLSTQFKDTDHVLELGCGSGNYAKMVANRVKHLTATDLAPEMVEEAQKKLSGFINVEVQKEDCYSTSFEDNTFDAVLMTNLLHIVKDPVTVMKESHRVLKDDGQAIIIDVTGYKMPFFKKMGMGFRYMRTWHRPPPHGMNPSPGKLATIVKEAGFVVEESKLLGKDAKAVCLRGKKVD